MLATKVLNQGAGPPLVFLHGFLGRSEDWIPVCASLPHRTCIAIDLPGHSASPFTEHFDEELQQLICEPSFHLIGYSMGGRLAMGFASRYPERVLSLTVLSAHFGLPESERGERLKSDAKWAQMLLDLPTDEFLSRWYKQPIFQRCDLSNMQSMRRHNQDAASLAKSLIHYSLGHQPIYTPKGRILVGEWDRKFRDLYRDHRPIVVPQAGHAIHLDQPQIAAQHIEAFCHSFSMPCSGD